MAEKYKQQYLYQFGYVRESLREKDPRRTDLYNAAFQLPIFVAIDDQSMRNAAERPVLAVPNVIPPREYYRHSGVPGHAEIAKKMNRRVATFLAKINEKKSAVNAYNPNPALILTTLPKRRAVYPANYPARQTQQFMHRFPPTLIRYNDAQNRKRREEASNMLERQSKIMRSTAPNAAMSVYRNKYNYTPVSHEPRQPSNLTETLKTSYKESARRRREAAAEKAKKAVHEAAANTAFNEAFNEEFKRQNRAAAAAPDAAAAAVHKAEANKQRWNHLMSVSNRVKRNVSGNADTRAAARRVPYQFRYLADRNSALRARVVQTAEGWKNTNIEARIVDLQTDMVAGYKTTHPSLYAEAEKAARAQDTTQQLQHLLRRKQHNSLG